MSTGTMPPAMAPAPAPQAPQPTQTAQTVPASAAGFQMPQPLPQGQQTGGGGKGQPHSVWQAPQQSRAQRPPNEKLGTGELLVQRRVKKSGTASGVDMSTAYDFEEMNSKLDKTSLTD